MMSIDVKCPSCGGFFSVNTFESQDTTINKVVRKTKCPGCNREFGVQLHVKYFDYIPVEIKEK